MDLFENEVIVSKIRHAVFIQKGTPIHQNRPAHGLVFYQNMTSTYRFDSGETFDCHSGDLIYLPQGSNYRVESSVEPGVEEYGAYVINFLTIFDQNENEPFMIRLGSSEKILSLFSKAAHAWKKKKIGYYEECMSDLYQIIKVLKKEREKYVPKKKIYVAIKPALDYISENFTSETIAIEHLANLCGVSEAYLRILFHRTFSVSPAVYIRNLRIHSAKELLLTGEYSVAEAATISGFNDISYFSREFKKATGVSPRDFYNEKTQQ